MNKLIKICEALNKVLKAVWPYLVALASGAVLAGCAIDKLMLELENARTAGLDKPAATAAAGAAVAE